MMSPRSRLRLAEPSWITPDKREHIVRVECVPRCVVNRCGDRRSGQIVPWLFHPDGKPIKDFRKAWALACQRAGVAGKVPDDLRRTAVRNLERAGVSRSAAMAMAGHRSESIYRGIPMDDDTVLKGSAAKVPHSTSRRRSTRINGARSFGSSIARVRGVAGVAEIKAA
jgi:integrase